MDFGDEYIFMEYFFIVFFRVDFFVKCLIELCGVNEVDLWVVIVEFKGFN